MFLLLHTSYRLEQLAGCASFSWVGQPDSRQEKQGQQSILFCLPRLFSHSRVECQLEVYFTGIPVLCLYRHPFIKFTRFERICQVNHAVSNKLWFLCIVDVLFGLFLGDEEELIEPAASAVSRN
jgi:hypothetical protein